MIRVLREIKGQSIAGEYAVLFVIVVTAMIAMGVFIKRSVQARWLDMRKYVVLTANAVVDGYYNGPLYYEYEPYYTNTISDTKRAMMVEQRLIASQTGHPVDIFRRTEDIHVDVVTNSITAPPKDAD